MNHLTKLSDRLCGRIFIPLLFICIAALSPKSVFGQWELVRAPSGSNHLAVLTMDTFSGQTAQIFFEFYPDNNCDASLSFLIRDSSPLGQRLSVRPERGKGVAVFSAGKAQAFVPPAIVRYANGVEYFCEAAGCDKVMFAIARGESPIRVEINRGAIRRGSVYEFPKANNASLISEGVRRCMQEGK